WCRRNPVVAALSAVVAISLIAGTLVSTSQAIRAARAERDSAVRQAANNERISAALEAVQQQFHRGDWTAAYDSVRLAEGLLKEGQPSQELAASVSQWKTDVDTMRRFDELRLLDDSGDDPFDKSVEMHEGFEREFQALGLDIDQLQVDEAVARVRKHRR